MVKMAAIAAYRKKIVIKTTQKALPRGILQNFRNAFLFYGSENIRKMRARIYFPPGVYDKAIPDGIATHYRKGACQKCSVWQRFDYFERCFGI